MSGQFARSFPKDILGVGKGSVFLDIFNYPLSQKFPRVQVKGDLSSSLPSCLLLYCLSVSNLFQFFLSLSASSGLFYF